MKIKEDSQGNKKKLAEPQGISSSSWWFLKRHAEEELPESSLASKAAKIQ